MNRNMDFSPMGRSPGVGSGQDPGLKEVRWVTGQLVNRSAPGGMKEKWERKKAFRME